MNFNLITRLTMQTKYYIVAIPVEPRAASTVHLLMRNGNMRTFYAAPDDYEGARCFKTYDGAARRMRAEASLWKRWAWAVWPVSQVNGAGLVAK